MKVFSEKGFRGASLRAIAGEAGINQPLIYWYFEGKEDLFTATLSELSPLFGERRDLEPLMDRPPEEVLAFVAEAEIGSYGNPDVVRLLRAVVAEAALNPEESGRFIGESQGRVLGFLTSYLRRQVELGRLKDHDVQAAARSFFGSLVFYVFNQEIFPHLKEGLPEKDRYIEEIVALFLDGLREATGKENG